MKKIAMSFVIFVILLSGCNDKKNTAKNKQERDKIPAFQEQFSWLEGTWVLTSSGGNNYERWEVDDSGMTGIGFQLKNNDTVITEKLWLVTETSAIFYVAHPVQNMTPVRFAMTASTPLKKIFENPQHDFPTVISYELLTADSLVVTIEGPAGNGRSKIPFAFKRLK